jgi:hypothetical protein
VGEERALTTGLGAVRVIFAAAVLAPPLAGAAAPCEALAAQRMPRFEVLAATPIAAGSYQSDTGERYDAPATCRVRGVARPTPRSRIEVAVWMPAQGWNGRYSQLGTGGFGGRIHEPSLAAEVRRGNAVASTDTGHSADQFDASWAQGHPQRIVDYGYRSIGATSDAARAIVRAYYGQPARKRYFVGCSNGGRQALMAAQHFPQDWDGILAGAPAVSWVGHFAAFAAIQQLLRKDEASRLSPAKVHSVQRAALRSCTAAARVVGDVPGDPRSCPFDPTVLLCSGREKDECLTPAQVASVAQIVKHGYEPTSAAHAGSWLQWIVEDAPASATQLTFAEQFFRYMVFGDSRWTVARFEAGDRERAERTLVNGAPLARVIDPGTDLRALRNRGGKILMYFGWADALLSPRAGLGYYERVAQGMGGFEPMHEFFRLFMVPGMTHCQGGPGPNAFGQAFIAPGIRDDSRHDIRRALEEWVEHGVAPSRIVAARYVNDDPGRGVEATRTLCAWPEPADCDQKEEGEHERS